MDNYDEHSRSRPYELPADLAEAARESDAAIRPIVQVVEGGYLIMKPIEVLKFNDAQGPASISAAELLRFMEPLHLVLAMDSAKPVERPKRDITLKGKTGIILLRFVSFSLADLQKILCKGGRNNLSSGTHASIAGLATWLTMHFGIAGVVSTGLATAILIAIAKATKGGFCRMTPAEIQKALAEASEQPR